MKNYMRFMIGVAVALSFVACGVPKDPSDTTKDLDRMRTQMEEDEKKQAADRERILDSVKDTLQSADELFTKGGQPGNVTLSGAFLTDGKLSSQIDVKIAAGVGKNGDPAHLDESRRTALISEAFDDSAVKALTESNTFLNFGCDISSREELKGMREVKAGEAGLFEEVKASVALFCHADLQTDLKVVVGKAIFDEAQIRITDSAAIFGVSLKAHEVVLMGSSRIVSQARNTLSVGPSITLGTNKLTGEGTLEVKALGADYKTSNEPHVEEK